MAWRWEEDRFDAGDVADPRPVMRLFNGLAGEINGHLDRDNIPTGLITKAKLDSQALVDAGSQVSNSAATAFPAAQVGSWVTVSTATRTITCPTDGYLRISASIAFYWTVAVTNFYNDKAQLRLMINGQQRAITGWYHWAHTYDSCRMVGGSPVMAGTSTVIVQARVWAAPSAGTTDLANGDTTTAKVALNPGSTMHPFGALNASITHTFRKR